MVKVRESVPRPIRDAVLKEFNHRCALCGTDRPQLHHIDENPSNNETLNLIPLCPNCHLTDQHDASNAIPHARLAFFRRYKHRHILKPQFKPIFRRMEFLGRISDTDGHNSLQDRGDELVALVGNLSMGAFYSKELQKLLAAPACVSLFVVGGNPMADARYDRACREAEVQYREQLRRIVPDVERLIVEMLDYQTWP